MKLYGVLLSPYVTRVLLAVRYKGLDIPLAPPPGGGLKSPEYLAINPYGKMPALEADGAAIIESEVICEFLDERFPEKRILPGSDLFLGVDMWPAALAIPGFLAGIVFSLLVWTVEGRRRFEELTLPRCAACGSAGAAHHPNERTP